MIEFNFSLISFIKFSVNILDGFGAVIILIVSIKAIAEFIMNLKEPNYDSIRLKLARGLALGLEFKIGSLILKTVAITRLEDIKLLVAILIIRTFLIFVISKEIESSKKDNPKTIP